MVHAVQPAFLHVLTPGNPVYAIAKIGAVGSLFALRMIMVRRKHKQEAAEQAAVETAAPATAPRSRSPHPVSRKKRKRRRRR
jgi:hypothetical protein